MKTTLFALVLAFSVTLSAQLPPPNSEGFSAGHHIVRAKDVEVATRFWTSLGGEPAALATIKLVKIPGVLMYISAPRGNTPIVGGNHGTTLEFLTFRVRDLKASLAKWKAAGIEPMKDYKEVTLLAPDDVQIRIIEDPKLTSEIAADGVIMHVPNVAEAAAWYAKWFGAKVSRSGTDTIADIPGVRITFRETKEPVAPTRGHSLNLLGFEVKDIQAFVRKYQEGGGKFDMNVANNAAANLYVIQLTDPWGTSIEVSQGFSAVK